MRVSYRLVTRTTWRRRNLPFLVEGMTNASSEAALTLNMDIEIVSQVNFTTRKSQMP